MNKKRLVLWFLILLLAPVLLQAEEQTPRTYRVLFINQSIELPPWVLSMFVQCREEFARLSGASVRMAIGKLDTTGSGTGREVNDNAHLPAQEEAIDFMVYRNPVTPPPLHLAAELGVPLVIPACDTACIQPANELPPNVHITTITLSPVRTARLVAQLCPDTRKLIVIGGSHPTDHFLMQRARNEMGDRCEGMKIEYWEGMMPAELQRRTTALPHDHAILFLKVARDPSGAILLSREVVSDLVACSPVPIFGISDDFMEAGIVGGYVVSSEREGRRAARMLATLAAGKSLPALTYLADYGAYQFNWNAMQRWGIRESRLPPGSRILNRPENALDRHPTFRFFLIGVMVTPLLIIGLLLIQRRTRSKAQKRLMESEQRLRLSTEMSGVAVWEYHIPENRLDRSANHDALYGWNDQGECGLNIFLNATIPEDRMATLERVHQIIDAGGPAHFVIDFRIAWPDESQHWLSVSGEVVERDAAGTATLVRGCLQDVSKRQQAIEALGNQKRRIDYILQGTNVGTWEWNVQTGETSFNERWAEIIGYTLDELAPVSIETWAQFCHPDDLEESTRLLQKCFSGEQAYYNCEARMRHKNGDWIWVLDRGKVGSWTDEGQPLWMYGTHQDITERKLTEQAVVAERDRAQRYLDIAGVMMIALDTNQCVTMINPRGCALLGAPMSEIIGKNWFDSFVPPEQAEKVKAIVDRMMKGEMEPVGYHDNSIVQADGQQRSISWHNTVLRDDDGNIKGLLSSGDDITERERAEKALRESEQHARLMADLVTNSEQPVAVGFADGRLGRFNPAFCELLGYTEEEIQTLDWAADLTPPEWLPTERDLLAQLERTGQPVRYEKEYIRKDGSKVPIELFVNLKRNADNQPECYFAFITDITERKAMENKLQESQKQLRLMFEQAPMPMCMNAFNGDYLSVNAAYEKLTGYAVDELRSMTFFDITHPEDRPRSKSLMQNMAENMAIGIENEKRYLCKDGSEIIVMVHGTAIHDANGAPLFRLDVVENITELKQAQKALLESHEQLEIRVKKRTSELETRKEEAETLNRAMINLLQDLKETNQGLKTAKEALRTTNKELEAFSYSVSHDLRAPLRHIDGFVKLLLKREKGHLDETSAHYVNTIAQSSGRMGQLIDDLLAFARTGRAELRPTPVAPNELIQDTMQELSSLSEDRHLNWVIEDLPLVRADRHLLRLVWQNLIGNAIKYTAPCAEARIEIGSSHSPDKEESDEIIFFIRDNGVGFDSQYIHKLFGVFQRLHRDDEFEGTGIGLATVRRIIHRHGGRVWAEGKTGEGATFYFTLKQAKGTE